jgi:PAS domain S-box-containing protein
MHELDVDNQTQANSCNATSPSCVEEGMVLQLANGTIQACNSAAEKLLGLTTGQILGWTSANSPWRTIHEDGTDFPSDIYPAMIAQQTGEPQFDVIMGFYHPDGDLIWLTIDAQPLFQTSGSTPYGVISKFKKISLEQEEKSKQVFKLPFADASHLELVQQNTQSGIWDWDFVTNIANVSPQYCTILGLEPETRQVSYEQWLEQVHPDDRVWVREKLIRAVEQGNDYAVQYRILHPEGVRWVDSCGQVYYDKANQPVRMLGNVQNITSRKEAEIALQQSEDRLRMALESAQMGVWDYNPIIGKLSWDNQCKRMWGLAPDAEVDYEVFLASLHPDDRECVDEAVKIALDYQSGGNYNIEYRIFDAEKGAEKWIAARGKAYFCLNGELLRFTGTVLDITNVKLRETERQRAQILLKDQQERLEAALFAAETGTFRWDIRTNALDWDHNLDRLFGLPAGKTARSLDAFIQMVHPDDRQGVIDRCQQCANKGANFDIDFRVVYPDGSIHWLSDKGKTFFDSDGQPAYVTGACVDITERKYTEEALRQSEEFKNRMLESSPDCIKVLDLDGRLLYMNTGGMCVMEIDNFTPYHNSEWICFWEGEAQQQASMALAAANKGKVAIFQGYCPTAKGTPKWWEVIVSPILNQKGQVEKVLSISRDITERKRTVEALRQSEERYRVLFESMEDGFCVINVLFDENYTPIDYRFQEMNPAFEVQTGLKQAEGKTARQLIPNLENHWFEIYGRVALTGEPVRFEHSSEVMGCFFDVYAFRIGQPTEHKVAILFREISERKAIEQQREKLFQQEQAAREAAERANRIKDEFLAILSHELRTPLNPILGWAKLLQSKKLNAAKTAEALGAIERNAKLQSQLIEDLLDVSRILRGKMALNKAPVNITNVINAALETVRLAAEAKNIQLQLSLSEVRPIIGDASRLQQVIWNLLTNAIKFTPSNGRVEVHLTQVESYAQIHVRDTGKGISSEFLPYVFEHFRQEDGAITRKFGGLGLGLAIVRQIVEMHGGTVQAHSLGEGQGATFTVILPLPEQMLTPCSQNNHSAPIVEFATLNGIRALVVDDELDSRDFIAFVLEQEGAEVVRASSAIEALQILDKSQFDILVSDIGMPDVDGYTFMRQIRKRSKEASGQMPAIALTAYASELDQRQAISVGFQKHLSKPLDPEQLIEAVIAIVRL